MPNEVKARSREHLLAVAAGLIADGAEFTVDAVAMTVASESLARPHVRLMVGRTRAIPEVDFTYPVLPAHEDDDPTAGTLTVRWGVYGPTFLVSKVPAAGEEDVVGYLDLFHEGEGQRPDPTFLFFDPRDDSEPAVKLVYQDGALTVVVHKAAVKVRDWAGNRVHDDGDHVFRMPPVEAPRQSPGSTS